MRFVTRENWFITNVIREICQNSYVKGTMTPPPPYYPLQMKLHLRYFRVVLFLLQRFQEIWIFRFFSWSLTSSIIQCTSVERNHVLVWVTTQQSELNELKLTVLWGQYHYKYNCYHWLGKSLSIYWLCFKSLSDRWSASLSTNNDSAKILFLSLNAIFEHHTLLIFLLINQLEFHINFCSILSSFSFMVVDSDF